MNTVTEQAPTVDTTTKHKRFGRVEAINRVSRVIVDTHPAKSYTYTVGVADDQDDLVVTLDEAPRVASSVVASRRVSATDAYTGEVGSLIRRHNSLFEVVVSRRRSEEAERFFIFLGDDTTPACRING